MKAHLFAFALAATLVPGEVAAQKTGDSLHDWCNSTDEVFQALCAVYIEGAWNGQQRGAGIAFLTVFNTVALEVEQDTLETLKTMTAGRALGVCVPAGAIGAQLQEIIVKFLSDHP